MFLIPFCFKVLMIWDVAIVEQAISPIVVKSILGRSITVLRDI